MTSAVDLLPLAEFRRRYSRGGGLWTQAINQRVGAALGRAALRRRLRPRSLSLLNAGIGIATSIITVLVYPLSPIGAGAAALVGWQLAYSADCADGQLARASGQASDAGAVLDLLCDYVVQLGLLAAVTSIAWGPWDDPNPGVAVLLAGLWLVGPFYSGVASDRVMSGGGGSGRVSPFRAVARTTRDYGLHTALISLAIATSPLAVIAILAFVGAMNFVFLCSRLLRLTKPELRAHE